MTAEFGSINTNRYFSAAIFAVAFLTWGVWFGLIILHRSGELPLYGATSGSLEKAGQFGDAFGALASLMAALAAAAALSAFLRQRKEVAAQEFDRNFFTLLANFQSIIAEIDIRRTSPEVAQELWEEAQGSIYPNLQYELDRSFATSETEVRGRDALRALLHFLRLRIGNEADFSDSKIIHRKYESFYDIFHDDLGHYFRTLYHIFKIIAEECPGDKRKYVRLARSHLSSSEITLLAYNCAVGEGRYRFKSYVKEFALLNNYHLHEFDNFYLCELSFFERVFEKKAFGVRDTAPFVYE